MKSALVLITSASLLLGGCASIINGSTKTVSIATTPPGAIAESGSQRKKTPCSFDLRRDEDHGIKITKEGYKTYYVQLRSVEGGAIFGNILLGGLIGVAVDAGTGASKTLEPDDIHVIMEPGFGEVEWEAPDSDEDDHKETQKPTDASPRS